MISPLLPPTDTGKLQKLSASSKHITLGHSRPANHGIIFDSKQEASHENHDRAWQRWIGFCTKAGLASDPFVTQLHPEERTLICKAFLACVQSSKWSTKGDFSGSSKQPVLVGTVRETACHWATGFWRHHQPIPMHGTGSANYHTMISKLFQAYNNIDPLPRNKKPSPPNCCATCTLQQGGSDSTNLLVTIVSAIMGFFWAMRSCKKHNSQYTRQNKKNHQIRGIVFQTADNSIIAHNSKKSPRGESNTHIQGPKEQIKMDSRTHQRTGDPIFCHAMILASLTWHIYTTVPGANKDTNQHRPHQRQDIRNNTRISTKVQLRLACELGSRGKDVTHLIQHRQNWNPLTVLRSCHGALPHGPPSTQDHEMGRCWLSEAFLD
jgi:hypothetical protein